MGKKPNPFITQLQAEGSKAERDSIKEETQKEARELAGKMPTFPPDRLMYVRNLTQKALKGEVDLEVFKLFIKLTNSWTELETCAPRARRNLI